MANMERQRICVMMAGCSRLQGGLFHSVRKLWKQVAEQGHQVEIKAVEDAYAEEDKIHYNPLPVKLTPRVGPERIAWSPQLLEYMAAQKGRHEVISSHGMWTYADYAAWKSSRLLNIPHIIHPHGMLDPWAVRNSGWKKQVARWLFQDRALKECACLRALTQSEAKAARTIGYNGAIAVIPNGIDPLELRQQRDERIAEQISRTLSGSPYILFLSRIHPKKNLPVLLKAWHRLGKEMGDTQLVIAGPDELGHQQELYHLVQEISISNIHFPGSLYGAAKTEWILGSMGMVLPSLSEGFPVVLLEAAALGKPVLMTPACYFPELEQAGGALCMNADIASITSRLRSFLQLSEQERDTMGDRGKALVETHYAWEGIARRMTQTVEWVLRRGTVPSWVETEQRQFRTDLHRKGTGK
jgi:glycosyltransferase involved in cell wall biosynthesis